MVRMTRSRTIAAQQHQQGSSTAAIDATTTNTTTSPNNPVSVTPTYSSSSNNKNTNINGKGKNKKRTTVTIDYSKQSKKTKVTTTTKRNNKSKIIIKQQIVQPPKDWEKIYNIVEELRKDRTAPVDHVGAEALPDKATSTPEEYRFQVLICLLLSSQTKDAIIGETFYKLKQHYKPLSINAIRTTTYNELHPLLMKVGFHTRKTQYLLDVSKILYEKYNNDIPQTAIEMINVLPGIGPKMAYIIENICWNKISGIGIDTHMHRIFNQIQWVNNTKTPEQTRIQLQSWLPKNKWLTINLLFVGFGQEVQQYPNKILYKAYHKCTKPYDAIQLLKQCQMNIPKFVKKIQKQNNEQQKNRNASIAISTNNNNDNNKQEENNEYYLSNDDLEQILVLCKSLSSKRKNKNFD